MSDILDILGQAGRSARDIAAIKAGLLRQNVAQNAGPMARGVEEGLIGEGVDMARAGAGALGDAYGAGDGALDALLSGYTDRMAKARARAAALRAQSPEAFEYGEKLPERVADAAGLIGVAGHVRMPEFPRIGPGAAPEFAFARAGGEMPAMRMSEVGPKPISRAGEPIDFEQRARHGTHVADMEKFDLDKIGTGEGAQAYGWGGYFAKDPLIGDWYRSAMIEKKGLDRPELTYDGRSISDLPNDIASAISHLDHHFSEYGPAHGGDFGKARNLTVDELGRFARSHRERAQKPGLDQWDAEYLNSRAKYAEDVISSLMKIDLGLVGVKAPSRGKLYAFEVPENYELLDYDAAIEQQPPQVLKRLEEAGLMPKQRYTSENSGHRLYDEIADRFGDIHSGPKAASEALRAAGIPGLRYLDAGSRGGGNGSGSSNFVIWDESRIGKPEPTTLERELQLMAGGE